LVLRLNQETVHDFILLFMPPRGPHLTPLATGSLEPSLLVFSTPGGLTGDDLTLVLHLHQHQSSHNLHLQYLAKNQSTQHCQSLITPGNDYPPVLEPHVVLSIEPIAHSHTWFLLMVKFRQPSYEFTFGVGMSFISYPLVLTPLV
jgi:hypothetical protein